MGYFADRPGQAKIICSVSDDGSCFDEGEIANHGCQDGDHGSSKRRLANHGSGRLLQYQKDASALALLTSH